MSSSCWEGEWELCNDDGFVYKRRKRHHDSSASAAALLPPLPVDPDAELCQRRAQKKKILMKVREQYGREIQQWEALLTLVQEMKEKTQPPAPPSLPPQESSLDATDEDTVFRPMIDELLLQAEAQEAFIQDMTNLCDIAETMCKAQEDQFKQSFMDLPVWSTPRSLMSSLTEVEDS